VSASLTLIGFVPLLGDAATGIFRAADKGVGAVGGLLKFGKGADAVADVEAVARMQAGRHFDKARALEYPANQVRVEKPGGGYTVLDSYNEFLGEIVSRKHTQLADIQEQSAMRYIRELPQKYPRGATVLDVPLNRRAGIAGEKLRGRHYLEVPVQRGPIPRRVLDYATSRDVFIRDVAGRIYN
jgi:hypothetical protein